MVRILCIQHSERVRPLSVETWAAARDEVDLVVHRVDLEPLPRPDEFDRVIVLGGQMNTDEREAHPWLDDERAFLAELVERPHARVFGICLGAQLLAEVLGGSVGRAEHPEIGWHPITLTSDAAASDVFDTLPATFDAFEWHGDSWALPPGASLIATSPSCGTQAFEWEGRVHAVQFHPEFTHERTTQLAATTTDDLTVGGFVQPAEQFLADPRRFDESREQLFAMLDAALLR